MGRILKKIAVSLAAAAISLGIMDDGYQARAANVASAYDAANFVSAYDAVNAAKAANAVCSVSPPAMEERHVLASDYELSSSADRFASNIRLSLQMDPRDADVPSPGLDAPTADEEISPSHAKAHFLIRDKGKDDSLLSVSQSPAYKHIQMGNGMTQNNLWDIFPAENVNPDQKPYSLSPKVSGFLQAYLNYDGKTRRSEILLRPSSGVALGYLSDHGRGKIDEPLQRKKDVYYMRFRGDPVKLELMHLDKTSGYFANYAGGELSIDTPLGNAKLLMQYLHEYTGRSSRDNKEFLHIAAAIFPEDAVLIGHYSLMPDKSSYNVIFGIGPDAKKDMGSLGPDMHECVLGNISPFDLVRPVVDPLGTGGFLAGSYHESRGIFGNTEQGYSVHVKPFSVLEHLASEEKGYYGGLSSIAFSYSKTTRQSPGHHRDSDEKIAVSAKLFDRLNVNVSRDNRDRGGQHREIRVWVEMNMTF